MRAAITIFDEKTGNIYDSNKIIAPVEYEREQNDDMTVDKYVFEFLFTKMESTTTLGKFTTEGERL